MLSSMKVVVLYRPNSEHARAAEDLVKDLERNSGNKVELVNADTRDGSATASLYDIMQYPAVLAMRDDGQILKDWQGTTMPRIADVSYYTSTW